MPRLAALLALALVAPLTAHAQAPANAAVPRIVSDGLDAVLMGRPEAGVALWARAWTAPDDSGKATTLTASLKQIGEMLGTPRGYDFVKTFDIGPHLRRVYCVIRYDRQPLYAVFTVYAAQRDWEVNTVTWNTDIGDVFPRALSEPTVP